MYVYYYVFLLRIVKHSPNDLEKCEGQREVLTCILNTTDSNITNNDVQWYRYINSTGTTLMVDQHGKSVNFITNTAENITNSTLIISNTSTSDDGFFWVGTPSCNVCNTSVDIGKRM